MYLFYIFNIFLNAKKGPFLLQSVNSGRFIGKIDNMPKMVDKVHAINFDIRSNNEHKSALCSERACVYTRDLMNLVLSDLHSTKFFVTENSDGTLSFVYKKNCLREAGKNVVIDECGENDSFMQIFQEDGNIPKENDEDVDRPPNFNYGIEDTDHKRDSIIKMLPGDENYSLVPRNRHHNSHTHKVGGFGDKAYYTYFSYHPSSRHSAYNFHSMHHGIPRSWNDDINHDN